MLNALIEKLSRQKHIPEARLEHIFKEVGKNAKKECVNNPYAVATAVVEKYARTHGNKE